MVTRGSEWRRWEPHVHAPGTVMNNQFGGADPWGGFLTALEQARPVIEAIAVTDYYVPDTYTHVKVQKALGRLSSAQLIFPNIELRLDVAAKRGFVNLHLLVSPEDDDHVEQLQRLLARLQFHAFNDCFDCTRAELIRLGRRVDATIEHDRPALSYGASQFKVNFSQLRTVIAESEWAKRNVLVAVAGGSTDGTSGVRGAADLTSRQEIEKFAHIIFSSNPAQREFWLGQGATDEAQLCERFDGLKPCLHGSDAHRLVEVGAPKNDRYSWIKGGLEFDALRQACIDPAGRAYVGAEPPRTATPSQVISHVSFVGAPWAATPNIPLNAGLVAIVGARGSGKTALADVIAAGSDSISPKGWGADENDSPSFLARARPLIGDAQVTLTWGNGSSQIRSLDGSDFDDMSHSQVRYLSQQFVEDLCSSSGASDGLRREIERVIFDAHPSGERDGAVDFDELLYQRATRFRQARTRQADSVGQLSNRVSIEVEKHQSIEWLKNQIKQKTKLINAYTADRSKLVMKGSEEQVRRHAEIGAVAEKISLKIRRLGNRRRTFVAMQDEVRLTRTGTAPEMLRQARARHSASGMTDKQWSSFLMDYTGNVDSDLASYVAWADSEIELLKGAAPPDGATPSTPVIARDAELGMLSLAVLQAEMARLEKLVSADKDVQRKYASLSATLTKEGAARQTFQERLTDAAGALDRARQLRIERDQAYGSAFDAITSEQTVLERLYLPLKKRLATVSGTLRKLSFSVSRRADVVAWAAEAEKGLLDLRKGGPFRGSGALADCASSALSDAWENGTSSQVQSAMKEFLTKYLDAFREHAPVAMSDVAAFRTWNAQFASWLYGTAHIHIRYGIQYDGVDIRKLSPGTRGIVLLLLYLALDDADDRPLVIDQPEENLDPRSVFDELVPLFIEAKQKRQVIIVTHNANLVVNTDADQIIIAKSGPHTSGALPAITYAAGGLESIDIRKSVCDILEGGEQAFRDRARRLRVRLKRFA